MASEQWANGETCRDLIERPRVAQVARAAEAREARRGRAGAESSAPTPSRCRASASTSPSTASRCSRPANGAAPAQARKPARSRARARAAAAAAPTSSPPRSRATCGRCSSEKGAEVEEGQLICIIEAMKMENEITAHKAGKIEELADHRGRRGQERRPDRRHQVTVRRRGPRRRRASSRGCWATSATTRAATGRPTRRCCAGVERLIGRDDVEYLLGGDPPAGRGPAALPLRRLVGRRGLPRGGRLRARGGARHRPRPRAGVVRDRARPRARLPPHRARHRRGQRPGPGPLPLARLRPQRRVHAPPDRENVPAAGASGDCPLGRTPATACHRRAPCRTRACGTRHPRISSAR